MKLTLHEYMIRIQRALIYGTRAEAVDLAVKAANIAANLRPEQIPAEIAWIFVLPFDAPTELVERIVKYWGTAKTGGNVLGELLRGVAKIYLHGQVLSGLEQMRTAVSRLGTAEGRIGALRLIVHAAAQHHQLEIGKAALEEMRYLCSQVQANPNLTILSEAVLHLAAGTPDAAEMVLGEYQEVLHGQHKDPYSRGLVERALGEVEVLRAFRLPEGPRQKQHLVSARAHFQRSWNLMQLCGFHRSADPTWSRADMYRALTHLHLFGAGAAIDTLNTGVDQFTSAPYVMNLDAATLELLLRLKDRTEDHVELHASLTEVMDKLNGIKGDEAWLAATGEQRTMLNLIAARINSVSPREGLLVNGLTHYKCIFRVERNLALRIRTLRWMADAMQAVPELAPGAPAIAKLADQLNEELEKSEQSCGLLAGEDQLWS